MNASSPLRIEWSNRGLALVRAAWVLTAVLALGILLASVPAYLAHLSLVTEVERIRLAAAGLPPDFSDPLEFWFDLASMLAQLASAAACLALAAVIFWRRPGERMASMLSFFLLIYGVVMVGPLLTLAELRLDWLSVVGALEAILFGGWALLFYLFPDGQFVPGWTRWLCVVFVAWVATSLIFRAYLIPAAKPEPGQVVVLVAWHMFWPVTSLLAQVYRYRRVSNPVQRQQTKWVLLAFALLVLVILSLAGPFLYSLFHRPANPLSGMPALARFYGPLWSMLVSALPLAMGVAILRFRLFDIDLFLNRSLVYGLLTAAVVALYAGAVGVSQAVVQSSQPLAPVLLASILVLLIVRPLRDGLQRGANRLIPLPARDPAARAQTTPAPWPRLAAWRELRFDLSWLSWFGLAAIALAALVASIPAYVRLVGVYTEQEQFAARLMGAPGLFSPSPQFEFWIDAAYNLLSFGAAALSLALAALIFWRRPREPIAVAVSLTLLIYGVVMAGPLEMLLGQSLAGQQAATSPKCCCGACLSFCFSSSRMGISCRVGRAGFRCCWRPGPWPWPSCSFSHMSRPTRRRSSFSTPCLRWPRLLRNGPATGACRMRCSASRPNGSSLASRPGYWPAAPSPACSSPWRACWWSPRTQRPPRPHWCLSSPGACCGR